MVGLRKKGAGLASVAAKLRALGTLRVAVGVLGAPAAAVHKDADGEAPESGDAPTVADVAAWNHYGTGHIPARPFIALALEQHKPELQQLFARIGRGVTEDKLEARQALGLMGEAATAAIKQQIAEGVPPPNAESTIDRKGSSTPLINFGQLRAAVSYNVREKGAQP